MGSYVALRKMKIGDCKSTVIFWRLLSSSIGKMEFLKTNIYRTEVQLVTHFMKSIRGTIQSTYEITCNVPRNHPLSVKTKQKSLSDYVKKWFSLKTPIHHDSWIRTRLNSHYLITMITHTFDWKRFTSSFLDLFTTHPYMIRVYSFSFKFKLP